MAKERLLHCLPVFTLEGESGSVIYWRRVPKKVVEALEESLPDEDGSWSLEDIGVFLPDHLLDDGMDVVESCMDVVWCDDCLEGHYCDEWKCDFDEVGFMPRNPEAKKPEGKINIRQWIEDRKREWKAYKEIAEDIFSIADEFIRAAKGIGLRTSAEAAMSVSEAASILGVTLPCEQDAIKTAFKKAAMKAHPDVGGSEELMKRVIRARDTLLSS